MALLTFSLLGLQYVLLSTTTDVFDRAPQQDR